MNYVVIFAVLFCLSQARPDQFSFGDNDPEAHMNVSELITNMGYPVERHMVTTEDGYILTMHRIPHGLSNTGSPSSDPKPVAFLQHGLIASSSNWVVNLQNESLGFILADHGYDVWMGNVRGNTYSKKHVKYPVDSDEFWDFSWDEMAEFDLPAMLNYALKTSNQSQIHYVGHSQGTTIGFASFSKNKELANKIKAFYALAPVTNVGNMTSPLKYLAPFTKQVDELFAFLGIRDFLPSTSLVKWFADHFCDDTIEDEFCENIIFVICGFDKAQLNMSRLDVYYTHTPAGTSVRDIVHFGQMILSNKFQMYDYGKEKNMKKYHQPTPPLYNATEAEVPIALFWADNDWLADPINVKKDLIPKLQRKYLIHNQDISFWDHLDFIWGLDAATVVYSEILKLMDKVENGFVQME